ncbi:MAG: FAD-binding oxidoreductase [Prevotella sp.]|jgi:D-lactate dehydrogenase|nr:FAD-binding oxidoreductase [Prevotella sp.]
MLHSFLQEIAQTVPSKRIFTDAMRRLAWGTDAGFYRLVPQVIIHSANEDEIISIIKAAQKYRIPLTFRAAGTSLSGQAVSGSVLVVAGKNWEKYTLAEDRESIRLQPGIIGERVNQILKPFGKKFPPDPASIKSAMVGGIVQNNASGMSCGIRENSYKMLKTVRLILADGTLLDTGDEHSKNAFAQSHPEFIKRIRAIRERVCADEQLSSRIRKKYSIKNVTGLNILPFVEYDDPFDIITHLIAGSEGTLAFLAEANMRTAVDFRHKANALLFFEDTRTASEMVVALKKSPVSAVEFFDRKALKSVEDAPEALPVLKSLPEKATSLLIQIEAEHEHTLAGYTAEVSQIISEFKALYPVRFTTDEKEYGAYWTMRAGIFPSVGGTRPVGTTCLIEDVAFPMEVFADAVEDVRNILDRNGYGDAVIYGHALEGNYHFILNQSFDTPQAVAQYEKMMNEIVDLVVDKYDGSLKAEHGTGRNMAPYVRREWGDAAYETMKAVKQLFDPLGILNPGVIFNSDPKCHIKNIKPLPAAHPLIDKCIECGFCEVNCLSCGFTLSSRQRIVVQREIARLKKTGENSALLKELEASFGYAGEQTCAGDGLCSTSCPVGINVGEYIHVVREDKNARHPNNKRIGTWTAKHFGLLSGTLKVMLGGANAARTVLGNRAINCIGNGLRAASGNRLPLWTATLPKKAKKASLSAQPESDLKVVYIPSCLNQMMGNSYNDPEQVPLMQKMVSFLNKAGYQVIFPENMRQLCCGTIWESKGMPDIADQKSSELEKALLKASENGKYPVLCDQSPCLYRMRHTLKGVELYEPVEFIDKFLLDRLEFQPTNEPITIHATCSTIKMGLKPTLIKIAKRCSRNVLVPEEVGCCGFAGDKGFFIPDLNKYALRKLRPQIEQANVKVGYSNSLTCEIGLNTNTGIPFVSIVYLVDKCTKAQ